MTNAVLEDGLWHDASASRSMLLLDLKDDCCLACCSRSSSSYWSWIKVTAVDVEWRMLSVTSSTVSQVALIIFTKLA